MTATSSKEQRYDRQLRLWGDCGQEILGKSKICLIGSSAIGSELLKNLVLPGIGEFIIIDDAIVDKKDLGNNFFVTPAHVGKPRAQAVAECASELNTDVRGDFLVENLETLLESDPNFFLDFSAIIYTSVREGPLIRLSRIVAHANVPIITCYSVGFVGFLRVSVSEHTIIESHPDSTKPDFRLDNPPKALIDLVNHPENDFKSLPANELPQVPWLIIVYKYLSIFQQKYGRFPSSYSDKQEIREYINEAAKSLVDNCRSRGEELEASFELLNFYEAAKSVNIALTETKLPPEVWAIFEDDRCILSGYSPTSDPSADRRQFPLFRNHSRNNPAVVNSSISNFWNLAAALKEYTFNEGGGNLPIRGDLPDMTSSSERYLKLLTVYREAAENAVEQIASRLSNIKELPLEEIRLFAKNAAYIRVIKCKSLEEELKQSPARVEDLYLIPSYEGNDAMLWYFMLRGAAGFYEENGRWPGSPCDSSGSRGSAAPATEGGGDPQFSPHIVELDMPRLRNHVNRVLTSSGLAVNRVSDDFVHEMCRFGGGEIHSIAAFMGGIAAQEVVKLVTHQFVPICHPLIYNGITQQITLLEF
nr:NEDD8 activating enzyme E1 regulatory subunit [Hymenolepis microstoma]